jgi:hypothetical protein
MMAPEAQRQAEVSLDKIAQGQNGLTNRGRPISSGFFQVLRDQRFAGGFHNAEGHGQVPPSACDKAD